MKFGKVPESSLAAVDFSFPEEALSNAAFLEKWKPFVSSQPTIRLGCPAWGCPDWKGKIYPANAKPAEFLMHYAKSFDTIELNTTHYQIPAPAKIQHWVAQVPDHFRFCPKVPQSVSHQFFYRNVDSDWQRFLESMQYFGEKLAPSFLQLPPEFSTDQQDDLYAFLNDVPTDFRLAIELRHASWFEGGTLHEELVDFLRAKQIGLVITDVSGRRDVLHSIISAPFSLIRFVGNSNHPTDRERASDWASRLQQWLSLDLPEVHFFIHQPDDVLCPETAQWLSPLLAKETHQSVIAPRFVPKVVQTSLF